MWANIGKDFDDELIENGESHVSIPHNTSGGLSKSDRITRNMWTRRAFKYFPKEGGT